VIRGRGHHCTPHEKMCVPSIFTAALAVVYTLLSAILVNECLVKLNCMSCVEYEDAVSMEMKTEADSNDITECACDDQSSTGTS